MSWVDNGSGQMWIDDGSGGGPGGGAAAANPAQAATPITAPAQRQAPGTPDYSSLFQPGYLGAPATVAPTLAAPGQLDINQLLQQWMSPGGPQAAQVAPVAGFGGAQVAPTPGFSGAQVAPVGSFGGAQVAQTGPASAAQSNATTGIDPALFGSLGAGNTIQQLLAGFAPQEQRAQNNLTQMLANFGVGGGQAVGAEQQLQAQQSAAIAPAIAAAIQNSQANQLNAGEFGAGQNLQQSLTNAGFGQQTGLANMQAELQRASENAGFGQQAGLANQQTALQKAMADAGFGQQAGLANQQTALQAALANAGFDQQAGLANQQTELQRALSNAGFQQGANAQTSAQGATNAGNENAALLQALGINTGNVQQANQFNAGTANTAAQYNANALNTTNAANVGQQNKSQEQLIQDMLNEYYAKMGAFNQINTGGQGAANQQAVQYGGQVTTTPDPFAQIFGSLAQGAGSYFGAKARPAA